MKEKKKQIDLTISKKYFHKFLFVFILNIVIAKVKDQMAARGASTIRGLGRVFKNCDDNGNRKLDA